MRVTSQQRKSAIVAIVVGLLFPFSWIVFTGEGRISEEHTIERSVADKMTPIQYEEFMREHSRPMTFVERIESAVHIAKNEWRGYIGVSAGIALIVFLVNLFVWRIRRK